MKLAHRWDIFCRVIDNYGDIGVCWRLAADLAARGASVRLWVDDARALTWMAPDAPLGQWPGVQILAWEQASNADTLDALAPADVWIEAFGCEIPLPFVAHGLGAAQSAKVPESVWINLEYLSAERFATRSHGLPSPVMHGVARGHTKYFYYPGFTPETGGLLREPELAARQGAFDRATWLARQGIAWQGEQLVSLFCYEPACLPDLLVQWQQAAAPTLLLVTPGRASAAVRAALQAIGGIGPTHGALRIHPLPVLSQTDFDHLLWCCDLNLVRGEDSVVRALWAGKPLLWQIYPQHDAAHHAKLQAFLDALEVPASLRLAHQGWNDIDRVALPAMSTAEPSWRRWAAATRQRLIGQDDLVARLQLFVASKRHGAWGMPEQR
ncbi:MAG: elongation factor P maturation arginine rhamnosyltransferase EarP [Burkholderiaceae bacterium]